MLVGTRASTVLLTICKLYKWQITFQNKQYMKTVTSKDGTLIAYEQSGSGEPVILVDGALCSRAFGPMPELAKLLAPHFSVINYDRRGRNESGDTQPYS